MKKYLRILIMISLLMLILQPFQARAGEVLIVDDFGLFNDAERADLEERAQKISDEFDTNVVILTSGAPYSSDNYARDQVESVGATRFPGGYIGYAINMADRSYWVDAYGSREREIFSQSDTDSMSRNAYEYLAEGNYYGSASSFLNKVDRKFSIATSRFGVLSKLWINPGVTAMVMGGAGILALGAAYLATSMKANKHKDKALKTDAAQYGRNFALAQNQDRLVRTYQTRVRVQEPSRSSGGGGFSSGGGVGHTGSGGHF